MKLKYALMAISLIPMAANAAIPYRTEQVKFPSTQNDDEAFARMRRFYVGGAYNFAMWDNYTNDKGISIGGKTSHNFEGFAGIRVFDTFRLEANYIRTNAEYNKLTLTGDTVFLNAIWDARIDSMYKLFRSQYFIPYVGIGAGLSWNSADDGIKLDKKISPAVAALAGIGIEFNTIFALDFGYRYFYMFNPEVDFISGFNPTSHQFRAGARISF